MLISRAFFFGIDALLALFSVYQLIVYLDIFLERKQLDLFQKGVYLLFFLCQIVLSQIKLSPAYINICITIIFTLIVAIVAYNGKLWNKCVFILAFNAIWMLMETLCGYFFINYFDNLGPQVLGDAISKAMLFLVIFSLKKVFTVFTDDIVSELPTNYSIILVLIPIGSIYIVNNIFVLSSKRKNVEGNIRSLLASVILLFINILVFYVYLKLADELRLKQCNAVYEQQLELYERHQKERELSMLQLRDVKHNMKNNLVSILGYIENGENEKAINFIKDIIDDGALNSTTVSNTGNIIIDSQINYWSSIAQRSNIDFSFKINIPMRMSFKGADLCLILGNMLENAVDAARYAPNDKYIRLNMKYDKKNLLISVLNSFNGYTKKTREGKYRTTKKDEGCHGVGIESIYRTADKYKGMVIVDNSDKEFLIKVLLYSIE